MQFEQGVLYHVYNRSINKELLYKSDENYRYFMEKFVFYLDNKIDVLAYCLMPTHFHFFVRATADSDIIEKGFKNLFISYAKSINAAYERKGGIFQAKYKKDEIANDFHLSTIVAYIHLNPVKAGLCNAPADWKYSSYNAMLSDAPTKVKRDEIVEWFGGKQRFVDAHKAYRGNDWIDKNLPE
ncbi:MAG: transposase [Chitinophagales bacterium]|nr:transposase [Chitinophagales bacterium]